MPSSKSSSRLLLSSFLAGALAQNCNTTCQSFGKDFVDGGSYFQNSASTANFTATEYFEGCQDDTAYNILKDPSGDQYECNNTPMTPDDAIQTINCPIQKDQLSSGVWSIIVLSNNGQCDPIDYIRSFTLSVGTQQTSTVRPTVFVSSTSTPISTHTSTITSTVTSSAAAVTKTTNTANTSTVTSTPVPATTTTTKGLISIVQTVSSPSVAGTVTSTTIEACSTTAVAQEKVADPVNTGVTITIIPGLTLGLKARDALPEPTAAPDFHEYKRAILEARYQVEEAKLQQRGIEKRAPDQPTTTVTSGSAVTSTVTSTAPTTTVTATVTTLVTSTVTPTVTVTSNQGPPATVTAPQSTITNTALVVIYITTTTKYTTTITATATATKCT